MRVLTVNTGSTSLKLERYALTDPPPPLADPPPPAYAAEPDLGDAERVLSDALRDGADAVMHRFVQLPDGAPPVTLLDAAAIAAIQRAAADDPLHDAAALKAVACVAHVAPDVPQYAVSDSAFHRTMPAAATTYALPREVTGTALHRLGYHGLSHEYSAHRGCALAGLDVRAARVVTAHLGGGSSLCAIERGRSIDTTMGYTPLDGLPMATRSGAVDPGLLLHLLRNGMSPDALGEMLERRSGLLGISGLSGDTRTLIAATDDPAARRALDVLVWRLRAALGAMIAVLGGADLIVFTGGIGEHAPSIRAAALANGLGIGAAIDAEANAVIGIGASAGRGAGGNAGIGEGLIGVRAGLPVAVVAAREGWQLARAVRTLPGA